MSTGPVLYKSIEGLTLTAPLGHFSARVAIWNSPDLANDRMQRGAFKQSLDTWARENKRVPVCWSHSTDPMNVLGSVQRWHEDDTGLVAEGTFDLSHPPARRAFELLRSGAVNDWSYAFIVQRATPSVSPDGQRYRDIQQVHLIECGPTLAGMHPSTKTLSVKDATAARPDPRAAHIGHAVAYFDALGALVRHERGAHNG